MDRERYPDYFLAILVLYAMVFLAGFSYFFVPAVSFGLAYADFYAIAMLLFLPLLIIALYANAPRIEFLWGKEKALRYAVSALTIIDFAIVMMFIILLI